MYILDTNLLIRFLTFDNAEKAQKVESLLKTSKNKLYLSDVALAEIVWVLKSVYEQEKEEIITKLRSLLTIPKIKVNGKVISQALNNYECHNIGWIDAYLFALVQTGKYQGIYSYDRSLDRISDVKRLEP